MLKYLRAVRGVCFLCASSLCIPVYVLSVCVVPSLSLCDVLSSHFASVFPRRFPLWFRLFAVQTLNKEK